MSFITSPHPTIGGKGEETDDDIYDELAWCVQNFNLADSRIHLTW